MGEQQKAEEHNWKLLCMLLVRKYITTSVLFSKEEFPASLSLIKAGFFKGLLIILKLISLVFCE